MHGRWAYADHIILGEARVVVTLTRLLGSVDVCHGHEAISLQDNMATSGAFTNGRSAAPSLNYLARQRGDSGGGRYRGHVTVGPDFFATS